ncbi:double-CXXCG motif protein [Comamonas sp. JC664]|uniref:SitI6 family double-CXXCG motif immunity protein n=1 Tax=Comamonas sp. JC664 TaxID=2801917 RepID=UPI001748D4C7|nr:double-CXXCG motif protein [Comamonas sp. JC664]MBL0698395.1 hypothetical protein [Comamonas sp. JC664]GHG90029.1 hypothetical protein GCM10012319_49870 [Comamonas sp. KCTC 72670]
MRFFEVLEDEDTRHTGRIDGVSPWCIPSIDCDLCGGYGGLGESYPTVDLSRFAQRALLEEPLNLQALSLENYLSLCQALRPLLPQGAPMEPGTQLGPVVGKAKGRFGNFYFQAPWAPWVRASALEQLQAAGVKGLRGAPGKLGYRGQPAPPLHCLELHVSGVLHPTSHAADWQEPCPRCGSHRNGYPSESAILDEQTLPEDADLFRLSDFKTVIVANERFVTAVEQLRLGDISFRELRVHPRQG